MTAGQLRKLLDMNGLTQRGAARELGLNERTMRMYVAGDLPVPKVVEMALRQLVAKAGKRVVGIDELTDSELESFNDAVEVARGATWSRRQFIHCEPVRAATDNCLCELRVYDGGESPKLLALIPIGRDGKAGTPEIQA